MPFSKITFTPLTASASIAVLALALQAAPAYAADRSADGAVPSSDTSPAEAGEAAAPAPTALADASAAASPAAALASSDAAAATAAEADAEIVVTARRREEKAQDVPIALSVVGEKQLEATGNYTLSQVQQLVPSLQVYSFNPRNTNINIRGLGSNVALTNDGLENGVGFYVDNVYYGRPGQSQFDLVDLAQIEVLRGPQGTLFGKNTTAGAINITTRLPSFDPELSAEASFGNYGYHQIRASGSAPIIDDAVALRISVADTHRDGYLTNLYNGSKAQDYDNFTSRAQLLIKPVSNVSVRLIGDYSHQKQHFVLTIPVDYFTAYDDGVTIPNNFFVRAARAGFTPLPANPFARQGNSDAHYQANMEAYGVSGEVNWDLPGATITSISAFRWWDWNPANDVDGTPLSVNVKGQQLNRQRQFSQEIRLASQGTRTIDYVVGAYYFWQIVKGYGAFAYGPDAALWNLPAVPAVVGNAALSGFEAHSTSNPETRSYAVFGQATWNISDALSLTGGLRYTHEKKHGTFNQFWVAGDDLSGLTAAQAAAARAIRTQFSPVVTFDAHLSDNSLSGLASASWKFTDNAMVYASYSRGNKSGGLNLTVLPAGATPEVDPEKVDSYEIGLKSELFDRSVTFNAAAFLTNIQNYQTAVTEQNLAGVFIQYIANIPKVRSKGLEGDIVWSPSRWVNLTASGAYTDAKYVTYTNAPQAPEHNPATSGAFQDLSGVQLAGIPKYSYSLGADLAQPVGSWSNSDVSVYGHADYSHRSHFNTSSNNSRYANVPGYGLLNARIGLRVENGLWDLSLFARNLANKKYFQTLSPGTTGIVTGIIGDPRTYGVTLRTKL